MIMEGTVAFSNLTQHEVYQGKSTGRYSTVLVLDDVDAEKLTDLGVNVKEYEGKKQRKFASQYDVSIMDVDERPFGGEIPYGSRVRVQFKLGNEHPVHGVACYLNKVKVLELAAMGGEDEGDDQF